MFRIEYFETDDGKCPVADFIRRQSKKERAKILREIDLLEEFGSAIGMPHVRKMEGTDDLWELRIQFATNRFRIFYFLKTERTYWLLHAFQKKTQKTPARDLTIAVERMKRKRRDP